MGIVNGQKYHYYHLGFYIPQIQLILQQFEVLMKLIIQNCYIIHGTAQQRLHKDFHLLDIINRGKQKQHHHHYQ